MDTERLFYDIFGDASIWMVCTRLLGAAVLCALIGFEREARDHAAGLRTNMLVGLAAASFALVTLMLIDHSPRFDKTEEVLRLDPLRLIEAVTGGVAFLAAGMIIFTKGQIHGLTTGASMWLSAAIGLAAGLGFWTVAIPTAIGGVAILTLVRVMERKLGIRGKRNYAEKDREP